MSFQWWEKIKTRNKKALNRTLKNCDSEKEIFEPTSKSSSSNMGQESDLAFEAASKIPPTLTF